MNKTILRLAIPNIVTNLTVPILSSVDTALMGHLQNPAYLGAIAVGGVVFNMIYWSLGFLRMGTTGLTAQAYGRKNDGESMLVFSQAMLVALGIGFLLLLLQYPIEQLGFWLIDSSEEVKQLAIEYYYVRIWAAPATIAVFVLNGWFLGMQNATFPMVVAILINVINIGLNFLFVYYFNMNVKGVALATVIAQYVGAAVSIGLFVSTYKSFFKHYNQQLLFQVAAFKQFFIVNRDIFIRTICLLITFSFFTAKSAASGDVILAANTILLQYLFIMAYGVDGFAFAAESLTGRFVGAKDKQGLKQSIRLSFYWGMVIALVFALVYGLAGTSLIHLFTNNETVIATAQQYMPWLILMPIVSAAAFIWDGIYIGATASVAMRNSMMAATFLFYFPAYYLLAPFLGNHALWVAMVLFMIARTVLQSLLAPKHIYQLAETKH